MTKISCSFLLVGGDPQGCHFSVLFIKDNSIKSDGLYETFQVIIEKLLKMNDRIPKNPLCFAYLYILPNLPPPQQHVPIFK